MILFATFLTLVLVPVMYSLVDDFTKFFDRYYRHREELPPPVSLDEVDDLLAGVPAAEAGAGIGDPRTPAGVRREREGGAPRMAPDLLPRPEAT